MFCEKGLILHMHLRCMVARRIHRRARELASHPRTGTNSRTGRGVGTGSSIVYGLNA